MLYFSVGMVASQPANQPSLQSPPYVGAQTFCWVKLTNYKSMDTILGAGQGCHQWGLFSQGIDSKYLWKYKQTWDRREVNQSYETDIDLVYNCWYICVSSPLLSSLWALEGNIGRYRHLSDLQTWYWQNIASLPILPPIDTYQYQYQSLSLQPSHRNVNKKVWIWKVNIELLIEAVTTNN